MRAHRKYLPLGFVVLGVLGSFLPAHHVSVSGTDELAVRAAEETVGAEETPSLWTVKKRRKKDVVGPGMVLPSALILIGILAGVIAVRGMGRWMSLAVTVLSTLGLIILVLFGVNGLVEERVIHDVVTVARGPGVGYYALLLGYVGTVAAAAFGVVRPDRKRSALGENVPTYA